MIQVGFRTTADTCAYLWLLWYIYRVVTFYFFPYRQALSRYKRSSPRAYALITGASGGIGYGYARELVAHGFGVILMANRKEKLQAAATALKSEQPNAAVETVSFDVRSSNSSELLKSLLTPFTDWPITMVINNVGIVTASPKYQPLSNHQAADVDETINSNIRFMTQVTRIMLPTLIRNGPSVVLSMGSSASRGIPYLSIYSGTKGYVASFGAALARESKSEGWKVDSFGVVAGEVWSEGNSIGLSAGSPTSRQFAKIALDRLEMAADREKWVMAPYWLHALQLKLTEALPEWLFQSVVQNRMKTRTDSEAKTQ